MYAHSKSTLKTQKKNQEEKLKNASKDSIIRKSRPAS